MTAYEQLTSLLETAMRIEREGLEAGFDMSDWLCGTSACLAGWHIIFSTEDERPITCRDYRDGSALVDIAASDRAIRAIRADLRDLRSLATTEEERVCYRGRAVQMAHRIANPVSDALIGNNRRTGGGRGGRFRAAVRQERHRSQLLSLLFGAGNGSGAMALQRQIKRIYYFMNRLETIAEYEAYQAMTRSQRRERDIARQRERILEAA